MQIANIFAEFQVSVGRNSPALPVTAYISLTNIYKIDLIALGLYALRAYIVFNYLKRTKSIMIGTWVAWLGWKPGTGCQSFAKSIS